MDKGILIEFPPEGPLSKIKANAGSSAASLRPSRRPPRTSGSTCRGPAGPPVAGPDGLPVLGPAGPPVVGPDGLPVLPPPPGPGGTTSPGPRY